MNREEMSRLASEVASRRDRRAFRDLFDFFAPRIRAYLIRLKLSDGEAEEITQEVMLTLWHKAGQFDPSRSSLSTWLFRIARNRRIDLARRASSGKLDENEPSLMPQAAPMPDENLDSAQRDRILTEAMAQLPDEQYEILRMAFFLGQSHTQISEQTGIPVGTVKSRIRLAFSRMRKLLEDEDRVDTDQI